MSRRGGRVARLERESPTPNAQAPRNDRALEPPTDADIRVRNRRLRDHVIEMLRQFPGGYEAEQRLRELEAGGRGGASSSDGSLSPDNRRAAPYRRVRRRIRGREVPYNPERRAEMLAMIAETRLRYEERERASRERGIERQLQRVQAAAAAARAAAAADQERAALERAIEEVEDIEELMGPPIHVSRPNEEERMQQEHAPADPDQERAAREREREQELQREQAAAADQERAAREREREQELQRAAARERAAREREREQELQRAAAAAARAEQERAARECERIEQELQRITAAVRADQERAARRNRERRVGENVPERQSTRAQEFEERGVAMRQLYLQRLQMQQERAAADRERAAREMEREQELQRAADVAAAVDDPDIQVLRVVIRAQAESNDSPARVTRVGRGRGSPGAPQNAEPANDG